MSCHSRWAGMYAINHWIPAFAGMTPGGRHGFVANPTALSAMSGTFLALAPSVIPAQAGIQWFTQVIPAKREW